MIRDLRELFETRRIFKALFTIIAYSVLFVSLEVATMYGFYSDTYDVYQKRLTNIVKTEGLDLNLLCNVVDCEAIKYNSTVYENNNGIIAKTDNKYNFKVYKGNLNSELDTIIENSNTVILISNRKFFLLTNKVLIPLTSLFIFFTTLIYISKMISDLRRSRVEKGGLKIEMESQLQRDLTESISHELGGPIAIVYTLIEDLYRKLYPCIKTEDGVCDFKNIVLEKEECVNCVYCVKGRQNRKIDEIAISHYYKIRFNLDRLNTVQSLVAGAKHIKYSNGTIALYEILDNVISSNNSYRVSKLKAKYKDLEYFNKYACGPGLSNGEMLIAMGTMITNSTEAKSTEITFSVDKSNTETNMLSIIVEDNGIGIRNELNEIIDNTDIFNYGFSTKDANGENIHITNWIKKFLYKLGKHDSISSRGVGLSLTKRIISNSRGDVELMSTSIEGTKFKVTIPIKIRKA